MLLEGDLLSWHTMTSITLNSLMSVGSVNTTMSSDSLNYSWYIIFLGVGQLSIRGGFSRFVAS